MACSKASCQSGGCNKDDYDSSDCRPISPNKSQSQIHDLCVKCKLNKAVVGSSGGSEDARHCGDCFRGLLLSKFRFAVTSNAMISSTDKVLIAFSAGPSSRVALQFVHEMQDKAQKNFDASRDKSLPVFGVGVAFIDESSSHSLPAEEVAEVIQHVKSVVHDLTPPKKDLHIVPLESLYSLNAPDGSNRLRGLLDAVNDDTGKEDLLTHLRMLCLQKVAVENGYSKLVLGSCTTHIACHVISATVKGQGYSLSADIQYADARWQVPVLLPLRDCLAQELITLCQLDGLKTLAIVKDPSFGINALVSSFISLLQEENPSRQCTILRTAGKLTPFSFNKLPETDDPKARLASLKRQKKFNIQLDKSNSTHSFCPLCYSPLDNSVPLDSCDLAGEQQIADIFEAICCSSCKFQILPYKPSLNEQFYLNLPQPIISRATFSSDTGANRFLREKLQDFLLSDSDNET